MKQYTLLCLGCLFSFVAFTQEFKFYLNGGNVENAVYGSFQKGDLMRIVFSGKTTPYKFRIASVLVTLTPRGAVNSAFSSNPTSFILDNTSDEYSNYPSFTLDLWERLALLRHNDYDLSIKVNQLFSDTEEGTEWIRNNVEFKQVVVKKDKAMAKRE